MSEKPTTRRTGTIYVRRERYYLTQARVYWREHSDTAWEYVCWPALRAAFGLRKSDLPRDGSVRAFRVTCQPVKGKTR